MTKRLKCQRTKTQKKKMFRTLISRKKCQRKKRTCDINNLNEMAV